MKLKGLIQVGMLVAGAAALAACSTGTQPASTIVDGSGMGGPNGSGTQSMGIDSNGALSGSSVAGASDGRTVFFDLNQYKIKSQYQTVVDHYASYLLAHPNSKVRISGYTDISGSREWNLTLSEERAKSVLKSLEQQGVKPSQVEVAGYGQEYSVPACTDKIVCWQNRRAVFQVTS